MSQNEQILAALKRGPLTPIEAMSAYKVMRLAARISDLRQSGHTIVTEAMQSGRTRYARYRLVRR